MAMSSGRIELFGLTVGSKQRTRKSQGKLIDLHRDGSLARQLFQRVGELDQGANKLHQLSPAGARRSDIRAANWECNQPATKVALPNALAEIPAYATKCFPSQNDREFRRRSRNIIAVLLICWHRRERVESAYDRRYPYYTTFGCVFWYE